MLALSPDVEPLKVTIYRGSAWRVTLELFDDDDLPVVVTGQIAAISLPGDVTWVATAVDNTFAWDVSASTTEALPWSNGEAQLFVNDALWASGTVAVV